MVHRTYRIGGVRFGVRTTSEEFGEWLDHALGAYRMKRRTTPMYSVVVGDGAAGIRPRKKVHVTYRGSQVAVRTRNLATLGSALLADLQTFASGARTDALYLSAALLASNGRTALIPADIVRFLGRSARRAERVGLPLPLETVVALDVPTGAAVPVGPGLDLPEDAVDRLLRLGGSDEEEDSRPVVLAPRRVDVVMTFAQEEAPALQPIPRALALHRTASLALNLPKLKGRGVEGLARLVEGARPYELGALDISGMLRALTEALTDGTDEASTHPTVEKIRRPVDERRRSGAYTPVPSRG